MGIMADDTNQQAEFDLEADPFNTGFEVNPNITTDQVIQWLEDRDSFLPEDRENMNNVIWHKAVVKAAIKNDWFTSPNWKVSDVGKWPLGQTVWLGMWCTYKFIDMQKIPKV